MIEQPSFAALSMQLHELFALMARVEREIADRLQRYGFRSPLYQHLATEMEARQAVQTGTLIALARADALESMAESQRRHAHNAMMMDVAAANLGPPNIAGFDEDHAVGASRSSVKRSHRAEGRNFID